MLGIYNHEQWLTKPSNNHLISFIVALQTKNYQLVFIAEIIPCLFTATELYWCYFFLQRKKHKLLNFSKALASYVYQEYNKGVGVLQTAIAKDHIVIQVHTYA